MTSRDAVEEGEREKREEGSSERDIMCHSEPTIAINPPPPHTQNGSFSPQPITSPLWGYMHICTPQKTHTLAHTGPSANGFLGVRVI